MWQLKLKDNELLLISLQTTIPTLQYIDKNMGKINLEDVHKIIGHVNRKDEIINELNQIGLKTELHSTSRKLNKNTDIIADQSYSERQLFEKAYERLKSEFEAVLKITPEDVQKKMDKALGRMQILENTE